MLELGPDRLSPFTSPPAYEATVDPWRNMWFYGIGITNRNPLKALSMKTLIIAMAVSCCLSMGCAAFSEQAKKEAIRTNHGFL